MSRSCLDPDLKNQKGTYEAVGFLRQLNMNWEVADVKEVLLTHLDGDNDFEIR